MSLAESSAEARLLESVYTGGCATLPQGGGAMGYIEYLILFIIIAFTLSINVK